MQLLETKHLILRPFRRDDAEAAYSWFGDPIVMRYTPAGPDPSLENTRARLDGYSAHQLQLGFSKWIVIERVSGCPVGDAGLLPLDDPDRIDLGFRFAQQYWGRGYATEVGNAWVRVAFEKLGIPRLDAFCHVENAASVRVLKKLGFKKTGTRPVLGMKSLCFSLEEKELAG